MQHIRTSLPGILALLILFALGGCKSSPAPKTTVIPVKALSVQDSTLITYKEFVGQVYGYKDIPIRARVDGFVESMHFKQGAKVNKGQLLYKVDAQPYEAEVAAAQSKVAEANTSFAKAQSDLNRMKPLAEKNAISQSDLDAAQAQYDAAEAAVEAAKANLKIAQIKLSYTQIKSPISGIIGKTEAKEGEYVGKSPNPVILNTVSRIDTIYVEFYLPEKLYLYAAKRSKFQAHASNKQDRMARKELPLRLKLADESMHDYTGKINFVDRGVDPVTGAILVQAQFANPERLVRPGQYAKVLIPFTQTNATIVPQKCVKELQGQYSVLAVTDSNTIVSRPVEIGESFADYYILSSGIKAGEKIVIEGLQKVRNGSAVKPELITFKSQYQPQ